jgi:hypothetical protein
LTTSHHRELRPAKEAKRMLVYRNQLLAARRYSPLDLFINPSSYLSLSEIQPTYPFLIMISLSFYNKIKIALLTKVVHSLTIARPF